jgi:hypothetical protein
MGKMLIVAIGEILALGSPAWLDKLGSPPPTFPHTYNTTVEFQMAGRASTQCEFSHISHHIKQILSSKNYLNFFL